MRNAKRTRHPVGGVSARAAGLPPAAALARVVEHYHRCFCEGKGGPQAYLEAHGLVDRVLWRTLRLGYADGSLPRMIPKRGELRDHLVALGVLTAEGGERLKGCVVVPIPDPVSGEWTTLFGRRLETPEERYLPGPLRGVLNFQAARLSDELVLAESVFDALALLQAGISTAVPFYGTDGLTDDHLDIFKRERVKRVVLAIPTRATGAPASPEAVLTGAGIAVRVAMFPSGIRQANELLVSRDGDAGAVLREMLGAAVPWGGGPSGATSGSPATHTRGVPGDAGQLSLSRDGLSYAMRVHSSLLGRLRVTVKISRGDLLHVDTLDLYASRSRAEFGRRVEKLFGVEAQAVEGALLALLADAEKTAESEPEGSEAAPAITISDSERAEALAFLRRPDLLDQVARDIDALGYVGEDTNKRLLYLVAVSRKQDDPLSAIVLSQSGAGKSGLTEMIERLTPPEDVVLFTRLTPQSLYYTDPGALDRKLIVVEERYGSSDADYSIRVLQSRRKLSVAAPIRDAQTGNLRTKTFTVEARAAFIEATTATSVNHENATRCFELGMDESRQQTERIHRRMSLLKTERGLEQRQAASATCRLHWNAQRLLEALPVVIPFAEELTFPSAWLRTRRDYARFLSLIEVSAFLHQYQRERRSGAVVANVADYGTAYLLAGDVLRDTLTDLKRPLREVYECIQGLCAKNGGSASRRETREAMAVPDSTVRGWLAQLCELEYLRADASRGGAGNATRYRITGRGPKTNVVIGLLTPEELAQKTREHAENPRATVAGSIS